MPVPIWNAAKEEARIILIERAKKKSDITYSELAKSLRTHHFEAHDFSLFALIGDISEEEDNAGNGMLSALVVTQEEKRPGPGFFVLAKKLGYDIRDKEAFWTGMVKRLHETTWDTD